MAELIWSPNAIEQLNEIIDYIARDSEGNAKMVAGEIERAAESARAMPFAGSVVPEYDRPNVRELLVCGYRMMYKIRGQSIVIALIYRGSRPLPKRMP